MLINTVNTFIHKHTIYYTVRHYWVEIIAIPIYPTHITLRIPGDVHDGFGLWKRCYYRKSLDYVSSFIWDSYDPWEIYTTYHWSNMMIVLTCIIIGRQNILNSTRNSTLWTYTARDMAFSWPTNFFMKNRRCLKEIFILQSEFQYCRKLGEWVFSLECTDESPMHLDEIRGTRCATFFR